MDKSLMALIVIILVFAALFIYGYADREGMFGIAPYDDNNDTDDTDDTNDEVPDEIPDDDEEEEPINCSAQCTGLEFDKGFDCVGDCFEKCTDVISVTYDNDCCCFNLADGYLRQTSDYWCWDSDHFYEYDVFGFAIGSTNPNTPSWDRCTSETELFVEYSCDGRGLMTGFFGYDCTILYEGCSNGRCV